MFVVVLVVMDIEVGDMMKHLQFTNYMDLDVYRIWNTSIANELGCLFQGVRNRIKDPTNTCHFIAKEQVPDNRFRDVTYGKFECTIRNEKAEKHRTRLVIGGNRIQMQVTWKSSLQRCFWQNYAEQCNINT